MSSPWRFLDTGTQDAAWNMALDEALLTLHASGTTPPTLRVYAWSQPTLSLGYAQDATQDVEIDACQAQGVTVLRRPTGGRAVLHDQEVTYSVIMPLALADGPDTITEHYRRIGLALAAALQALGLPVHLARPSVRTGGGRSVPSPACFAALSRYELSVAGRKLVGSAQKRGQQALLQHGSIPLWLDRSRLFTCLRVPPEQRAGLIYEAARTMGALNELLPTPVTAAQVHAALRQGFQTALGVTLAERPLEREEHHLAQQLRLTKYTREVWNLGGASAWRQRAS